MAATRMKLIWSILILGLSLVINISIVYSHQHGNGHRTCGTVDKTQSLMAKSPEYKQKHDLEKIKADKYVQYMKHVKNHAFHKDFKNINRQLQEPKQADHNKKFHIPYLKKHEMNKKQVKKIKHARHQKRIKRSLYSEYDDMIDKEPIILIPIVYHVLYSNSDENLSDAQLQSQITVLNKDFRAANDQIVNGEVATIWQDRTGDAKIEFYINETKRVAISNPSEFCASESSMKLSANGGSDAVDPKYFLNIWICDISGEDLLGYAYQPCLLDTSYEWQDGLVLGVNNVGSIEYDTDSSNPFYFPYSTYNLGRTATHEVGHYLNLDHIWGATSDQTCDINISDDYVSDTPVSFEPNYGCPNSSTNTCDVIDPETGTDLRDMYENFMDYTDDDCMFIFTEEQVWRMRSVLSGTGCRQEMYYKGAQLTNTTYQTLQPSTPRTTGPTFTCDDGCLIAEDFIDDDYCDCSNCEDETSYTCATCGNGCPNTCGDYTDCSEGSGTDGGSSGGGGDTGADNNSSLFTCDDGCTIDSYYYDDFYCDCSNCEDEPDWNCTSCQQGCPTECNDFTECFDSNGGTGSGTNFTCNDGCIIDGSAENDNFCDCTQCEDEIITNWTCNTCSFGIKLKNNEGCNNDCQEYDEYGGTYCPFSQALLDFFNVSMTDIAFQCDDGCFIYPTYYNDSQCDCTNCEDEPNWTCDTCIKANGGNGTCPTSCGQDWKPLNCIANSTNTDAAMIYKVQSNFQFILSLLLLFCIW